MDNPFIFTPRIIRSPVSDFSGREIEDSLKAYPDDYLREIAAQGYNGIWLHSVLRATVASGLFPLGDSMPRATHSRTSWPRLFPLRRASSRNASY